MSVAAYIYRDARRSPRFPADRDATVQDRHRRPIPVRIHSISQTGCAFYAPMELAKGETVGIEVGGRSIEAVIAWGSDGYHGCSFATPIDDEQVGAILERRPPPKEARRRLPPIARIGVIVGLSSLLWATLVAAIWVVVRLIGTIAG